MKIPRDVSGRQLATMLCRRLGYAQVHQVGSHVILETADPFHQRVTVPDHDTIRIGTLNSILRAVSRHKGMNRDAIVNLL